MSRLYALPGGGGHVAQVRPSARQQARTAGHPSVAPYDYAAEPDAPMLAMTDQAWHALNIVCHSVRVPGAVPREKALEQVDVLAAWYTNAQPAADECPPQGIPRPGGVA